MHRKVAKKLFTRNFYVEIGKVTIKKPSNTKISPRFTRFNLDTRNLKRGSNNCLTKLSRDLGRGPRHNS